MYLVGIALPILSFFAGVQLVLKFNFHTTIAALVAAGIPYAITITTAWIDAASRNLPIFESVFSLYGLTLFIVQFIFAMFVFQKIRNEESIGATVGWSVGGFLVFAFAIPFIVQKLIMFYNSLTN